MQDPNPPENISTFVSRRVLTTELPFAIQCIAEALFDSLSSQDSVTSRSLPRRYQSYGEILDLVNESELPKELNMTLLGRKCLLGHVLLRLLQEEDISSHATAAPTSALVHHTLDQLKKQMERLPAPQVGVQGVGFMLLLCFHSVLDSNVSPFLVKFRFLICTACNHVHITTISPSKACPTHILHTHSRPVRSWTGSLSASPSSCSIATGSTAPPHSDLPKTINWFVHEENSSPPIEVRVRPF